MGAVGFVSALLLAVVFVWAAGAKVTDRRNVLSDFATMGLPAPAVALVAVVGAELATAGLLVVRPRWGAVMSIVLLAVFTMALLRLMASGREVRCGCFGANHREPISMVEVVRNLALVCLAALALGAERGAPIEVPTVMIVSLTALCLLLGLNLVALAQKSGALFRIELAGELSDAAGSGGDAP